MSNSANTVRLRLLLLVLVLVLPILASAHRASNSFQLQVEPSSVNWDGEPVTVSWNGVTDPVATDFVGIFLSSSIDADNLLGWINVTTAATTWEEGYGKVSIPIVNLRSNYYFQFVRDGNVTLGSAAEVVANNINLPAHLHVAPGRTPSEISVMWVQGAEVQSPVVAYSSDSATWTTVAATVSTYSVDDLCDTPGNDTNTVTDFIAPGYIYLAVLDGLQPDTEYRYYVGSAAGFSEHRTFRTFPAADTDHMVHVDAFGDLGVLPSFSVSQEVQPPSYKTMQHIENELRDAEQTSPDLILHIGDISYARGHAYLWDLFFHQIEPVASAVPYAVCIGNHEYDYDGQPFDPAWGDYGNDSGGECGVPYMRRFHMPVSTELESRNLWYSINLGPVHIVLISTEHNFLTGSPQYQFVVSDLKAVDHDATPWIVVAGHRPMYTSDAANEKEDAIHEALRQTYEPLFQQYRVDVALWGHVHKYERTCPMSNYECVHTGGTTHVVIGMAGNTFQPNWNAPDGHNHNVQPEWSIFRTMNFGYTRFHADHHSFLFEFIGEQEGQVHDFFRLEK